MLMSRAAVEIVLSFTKAVADEASAAMFLQQQQSSSSSPSLLAPFWPLQAFTEPLLRLLNEHALVGAAREAGGGEG